MNKFEDILHIQTFVLNVDSKSDRWFKTKDRLDDCGFMNYQRWQCADGRDKTSIKNTWDYLSLDSIKFNTLAFSWSGTFAGTLSYLSCLKHIIDRKIPYSLILEDDIQFHPDFLTLGDDLFKETPNNFDVIYLGSQTEYRPTSNISVGQVYGGWSMLYSLEGAKKVYNMLIAKIYAGNLNCVDMEMYEFQKESFEPSHPFNFFIWSTRHNDYTNTNPDVWGHGFWYGTKDPFDWEWKYDGVIFPDPYIKSTLSCGCIDPRRLEFDPEIKAKYCTHTREDLDNLKKDLGFEIYT